VPRILGVATIVLALTGCTEGLCDRPATAEPIPYTAGGVDGCAYQTAEWDGDYLWFPGGAYYELRHQLGAVPTHIECWLSFARHGTRDNQSVTQAGGNECEIHEVTSDTIVILNGTCSDFYVRVSASVDPCPP
jgi:hypothetical protein